MRSQASVTGAAATAFLVLGLGLGFLGSCESSLGGGNGTGGQGGAGAATAGGAGAGGSGGTATGGSGGTAGGGGGRTEGGGGVGGRAGSPGSGGANAGGKGGGTAPCGAQSCASNEVCVHPGCGGGVAVCEPLPDGGQCPSGWTESLCPAGALSRMGCVPGPCTPPPPFCAPLPASCGGTVNCTCLPQNVCGQNGGVCSWILSGGVMCGFA